MKKNDGSEHFQLTIPTTVRVFLATLIVSFLFLSPTLLAEEVLEDELQEESLTYIAPEEYGETSEFQIFMQPANDTRIQSFDTTIDEIPNNVTIKTTSDLNRRHPQTFQEAIKDVEGVILFDEVGNGRDATFGLRGFADSSAIVFLVDGVRVNELDGNSMVFPLVNMNNVGSIQIERGSGSPVYGNSAFAGVVNINTRQASEKPWSLFGGLELSSHKGIRFNQGVSGTIQDKVSPIGGALKYYFNGSRDIGDTFKNATDFRITSFDTKVSYELPDEQGRIYVGVKHVNDTIANPGEMTFQQFHDDVARTNKLNDRREFKMNIIQFGADAKFFENHILASIMASWRTNKVKFVGTTASFTDFVTGSNPDVDTVSSNRRAADLIWQVAYEDTWDWFENRSLIGMEFRDGSENSIEQDSPGGEVSPLFRRETSRASNPSNWSLFWRQRGNIKDKVIGYVGMRHDFYKLQTTDDLAPGNNLSKKWSNSSLSTGITVKPIESVDFFASFSQGFRIPNISEINPFSGNFNSTLRPEKTDSFEFGTRLRYKELAALKFNWFHIDLEDEITFDSSSRTMANPFGQNVNIGKSRRMGVETNLKLRPIQELEGYATYTWTRAYVRETDGAGAIFDGRTIGQVPEHRWTLGATLKPFARLGDPFDGFRMSLDGMFVGKQHPTSFESATQAVLNATGGAGHIIKPYSIWDLMFSYVWKNQEIYLKVNNLFDEKYYSRAVSATSFGTAIYPAGTFTFVNPGAPREIVAGVRWEIG